VSKAVATDPGEVISENSVTVGVITHEVRGADKDLTAPVNTRSVINKLWPPRSALCMIKTDQLSTTYK